MSDLVRATDPWRPAVGRSTSVSLALPDGLAFDAWAALGETLAAVEHSIQWWVGDWWVYGEHRYGERKALVERLRAEGRRFPDYQTCMNYGAVARAVETSRRREALGFSHHAEVAGLPPDGQDVLLGRAASEGLTVREVRAEVARRRNAIGGATPDGPTGTVADLDALVAGGARFGCVYADPPWPYDNQGTRAATGNHYGSMTVEEIRALPVRELAADDAHLHLWTTVAFRREAERVAEAWGFAPAGELIWDKGRMGLGNYWRLQHETLLLWVRGDATRFADHGLPSVLRAPPGPHSEKPEEVRSFIERASPAPRLELFGRRPADGWRVWGDQVAAA